MIDDVISTLGQVWDGFCRLPQRAEELLLAQRTLTAFLPLAAGTALQDKQLREALERFEQKATPHLQQVPALHSVRWALLDVLEPRVLEPDEDSKLDGKADSEQQPPSTGPLVFECVYDDDAEDLLLTLFETIGPLLDAPLKHCADYPDTTEIAPRVAYLLRHHRQSGYLFRDRRVSCHAESPPSCTTMRHLRSIDTTPAVRTSRDEIVRALELRRQLLGLVARNQRRGDSNGQSTTACTPQALADGLQDVVREADKTVTRPGLDPELPALSSTFEERIPDEGRWLRRAAALAGQRIRRSAREQNGEPAHRAAHAKSHGLYDATFEVNPDIDPRYQQGIFVPGAVYKALVRPSNAHPAVRPDRQPDGRGLSIKVLGVESCGTPLWSQSGQAAQDFVLMSHPTFFAKNARDYAVLLSLTHARTHSSLQNSLRPRLRLALAATAFALCRPRELKIFYQAFQLRIDHPFEPTYHSGLACLHGPQLAVKYSVRAQQPVQPTATNHQDDNFLSKVLQAELLPDMGKELVLEFAAHVPKDLRKVSVEDPREAWHEGRATRIPLAKIRIRPQLGTTPDRMAQAEALEFNPWHALPAHRPLGSLSRARLVAYRSSASLRKHLNAAKAPLGETARTGEAVNSAAP